MLVLLRKSYIHDDVHHGSFEEETLNRQITRAIHQSSRQLLDYKNWSEKDRKMFSEQRRREEQALLAQDFALEKGIEQGLERGKIFTFLDLVHQHVLTSKFASEQLGMTAAEFDVPL